MAHIIGTILPPPLPDSVPQNAQWLSGQGAGVWFCLLPIDRTHQYNIKRFSPEGDLHCDRIFELEQGTVGFDPHQKYSFTHISHCSKCRVAQHGTIFVFHWINSKR